MDVLFRIIGFLSIPLTVVAVVFMINSLGREQRLTSRSLVIQLVTSPAILVIYAAILAVPIPVIVAVPLLLVGLALGALWGKTTALSLSQGQVFGRRSIRYLIIWGATFVITQGMALIADSQVVSYGLSSMFFSTGIAAGMNANLLFRRSSLVSHAMPPGMRCSACGAVNRAHSAFCVQCGLALAPSAAATSKRTAKICPKCGYANRAGFELCVQCGTALATTALPSAHIAKACPRCGYTSQAGTGFCPQCGTRLERAGI